MAILADASAVIIKKPPPSTKEITAPSCGAITNAGSCENGVAKICDTERDTLVTTDCTALGQDCAIDKHQGATCLTLTPPQAPDPTTSCPGGKVDTLGYCAGNVAIWCSQDPLPVVASWDCSKEEDKLCKENDCQQGAYCCSTSTTAPEGCGELTDEGICTEDNEVQWCDPATGQVSTLDCTAQGKTCQVNECGAGANCCATGEGDCSTLGPEGECVGNLMRYCTLSGVYQEEECPEGTQCQFDTCISGFAWCCSL